MDADELERHRPADWGGDTDAIHRTYEFDAYLDGVAFARRVGEIADEAFHHPTIEIGFREVTVHMTSHEAGGVTETDVDLARRFDEAYAAEQGE